MTGPSDSSVQVEALKGCPFCGGEARIEVNFGREYWVQCQSCDACHGVIDNCPANARATWNRRAALPVAPSVPAFDPTQPCDIERIRRGEKFGWGGVPTMCMRCKNPHHACDHEVALPVEALSDADRLMEQALERIEQTLTIPAAEYVPAIGDVFLIIDQTRAALRTRLLRHSEGKE